MGVSKKRKYQFLYLNKSGPKLRYELITHTSAEDLCSTESNFIVVESTNRSLVCIPSIFATSVVWRQQWCRKYFGYYWAKVKVESFEKVRFISMDKVLLYIKTFCEVEVA